MYFGVQSTEYEVLHLVWSGVINPGPHKILRAESGVFNDEQLKK